MRYVKQVLAEIDSQLRQLQQVRHLLASIDTPTITKPVKGAKGKRHMSAAAIARIRAAQKARWAKFHAHQRQAVAIAKAKGKK